MADIEREEAQAMMLSVISAAIFPSSDVVLSNPTYCYSLIVKVLCIRAAMTTARRAVTLFKMSPGAELSLLTEQI